MTEARAGRPEAAAAIWDWRGEQADAAGRQPTAGSLRRRGLLQGAVAAGVGAAIYGLVSPPAGLLVLGLAAAVALAALLAPTTAYAAFDRLVAASGRAVGIVLGWVLLVPVFFLFFAPFGWLFRRGSRDRLKRHLDPGSATYWESREGAGPRSREHQY